MNQFAVMWAVLLLGSTIAGASVVCALVVRRTWELPAALAGAVGFGLSAYGMVSLPQLYSRPDVVIWAFAFMLGAGAGGYALASTLLHRLAQPIPLPAPSEKIAPHDGVAVIITACIEPSTYAPRATAGMLQQLADEDLLEASIAILPFLFFAQKARYRAVSGHSPASTQLASLADRLQHALGAHGVVSWATCSGPESVEHAAIKALSEGYRTIVVAGLAVADPAHYTQARNAVEDLHLEVAGASIGFTSPLFDSDRLIAMLAARVLGLSSEGTDTGVVLVGHGQPESRARRNPSFDEQELSFLSRLRMLLLERGMPSESVRIAWADWNTPDIATSIRHLAALGLHKVLVVPAAFPLDTLATRLDMEMAVRQAHVDDSVDVVMMSPWRDDDAVLAEIRQRVLDTAPGSS